MSMIAYNLFRSFYLHNLKPALRKGKTMLHIARMILVDLYGNLTGLVGRKRISCFNVCQISITLGSLAAWIFQRFRPQRPQPQARRSPTRSVLLAARMVIATAGCLATNGVSIWLVAA